MFNFYENMKSKHKKEFDESIHFNNLHNVLLSMFDYQNLPETLRSEFIESNFICGGTCGVGLINDKLYTGEGGYCGNVENYLPVEYQINNNGIGSLRGRVGTDIIVGWNNATATPDLSLIQTSSILTEIDVSERINIIFARFLRMPKAKDNKEKAAIEAAIKKLIKGDIEAIVSDNIHDDLLGDSSGSEANFLDLVDIKQIDKLQYLNQYRDNVIKRFFQMHGQGIQTTSKLAQQTNDELHGNDTVSMILPVQKLKYRKKFVSEINERFGTKITVDFSECFKDSYQEMKDFYSTGERQIDNKGGIENVEDDQT